MWVFPGVLLRCVRLARPVVLLVFGSFGPFTPDALEGVDSSLFVFGDSHTPVDLPTQSRRDKIVQLAVLWFSLCTLSAIILGGQVIVLSVVVVVTGGFASAPRLTRMSSAAAFEKLALQEA